MNKTSPVVIVLRYSLVGVPVAALVFLLVARFFTVWDGYAVGMRPLQSEEPSAYAVLIVDDQGNEKVIQWPADLAEGRNIPTTPYLVPPPRIPDDAPHTQKTRFTLHFLIQNAEGAHQIHPTTTPAALALAVLAWLLGLLLRNAIYAGNPFDFSTRRTTLPRPLPAAGQVAGNPTTRSKQGPPPPKPRGRRRH